ncbi:MAG: hypothetical protein PHQ75_08010 [Thermoguttaceae bacterium]|nr:hypothetical protein [Thermoguttaceae bacterium]
MSLSERKKELNTRRKRRIKISKLKAKLPKMDAGAKAQWAEKLRRMTAGAEILIKDLSLEG